MRHAATWLLDLSHIRNFCLPRSGTRARKVDKRRASPYLSASDIP
jgi:hypothetical protein